MKTQVPDESTRLYMAHDSAFAQLVRCRVTALLDCGASVDGGVHLAGSVPQLINQARMQLSAQVLLQVVRWRVEFTNVN
jgi:hypothetical protein